MKQMNADATYLLSADHLPERKRFQFWEDVFNKSKNPIAIDTSERENFHAKVNMFGLGDATYVLSEGTSPFTGLRTSELAAQGNNHPFQLAITLEGSGNIKQGKFEADVSAGDVVLFDTKQDASIKMENSKFILLSIPESFVRTWIPNPEDYVAHPLPTNKGWAGVLSSYLRNLNPKTIGRVPHNDHILVVEHVLSIYLLALEEVNFLQKKEDKSATTKKQIYTSVCTTGCKKIIWIRRFP
ncbi:AraC-like ligand-binding domain-containing protein [Glaciimonas sp. GG7]